MMKYIFPFNGISEDNLRLAGGKGASLVKLRHNGLNVPDGYIIISAAFENNILIDEAKSELTELIRNLNGRYAVRSSAIGEDGAEDSFAGAYETRLDVPADKISEAVQAVADSADNERVSVYAENRNTGYGRIAVVIQRYISPEYAGVLFTADAISASAEYMTGNYVSGVGEALVSGESSGNYFRINAVKYAFDGGDEIKRYGQKLFASAKKITSVYECPMDIEWAVSGGKVYILQARPITTIHRNNADAFDINDSLCGELLLSKTNVGEIFLRPVSPVTYGIVRKISDTLGIPLISNVCGQLYLNISGLCSMIMSFGFSKERSFKILSELAGGIPKDIDIPVYPFDKKAFTKKLRKMLTGALFKKKSDYDFGKNFKSRITEIGNGLIEEIRGASSAETLEEIWNVKCTAYMTKTLSAISTALSLKSLFSTREKLEKQCGSELADLLLSDCSENGSIESIGTLLALDDVANGKLSREEYIMRYGHRHANEMELSLPYPYEDPAFPENAVQEYIDSGINAYEMKSAQELRRKAAVAEFKEKYPSKSAWLDRTLKKYAGAVYSRELVRSEALRLFCVIREYLLKAGQFSGLGEDIFMLCIEEVSALMKGDTSVKEKIALRKETYLRQLDMPNFPSIICGRFTFEEWQQSGSPSGYYRFGSSVGEDNGCIIKGVAGSCGQAVGKARVLSSVDEADTFEKGEILVVQAANIGWIRIFPKAAALVTDIGAPLSHAVIVARELGLPAVVSCQSASGRIKTGDTIRVDGLSGTVEILYDE